MRNIYIYPACVNFEISKSSTLTRPFDNIYSSASLMKHFLLWIFPVPEAAMTIQNKFRHEGVIIKWPRVYGPIHLATKGNAVPICKSTGVFVCSATKLWNCSTSSGRIFCQLYLILYASSYNFLAVYDPVFWDISMLLCHYTCNKHGKHFYRIFLNLHLYVGLYAFTPTLNCASCPFQTITWVSNLSIQNGHFSANETITFMY